MRLSCIMATDGLAPFFDPPETAPDIRITVRTSYDSDVKRLQEAGATHIVTSEAAAAVAIVERVVKNSEDAS